jgi:hypothetical protein
VTGEPPPLVGAIQDRLTDPLPGDAVKDLGAEGTVAPVATGTADASLDGGDVPALFTAATV